MAISCGVDIIEIDRIRKAIIKNGDRFKNKVFTCNETIYCEAKNASRYQSYAVRFAAKEAVSKALGSGMTKGIEWTDIEVLNDEFQKPYAILHGKAKECYVNINGISMCLSLSHCKEYAIAQVVIETGA